MEKTINIAIVRVGKLISPRDSKLLKNIDGIQSRTMCATFNVNTCTKIISCYIPINPNDETNITTFYTELSSLVRHIPKHNILIIGVNMNAQKGKTEINSAHIRFSLVSSLAPREFTLFVFKMLYGYTIIKLGAPPFHKNSLRFRKCPTKIGQDDGFPLGLGSLQFPSFHEVKI